MLLFIRIIGDFFMKITKSYLKNIIKEELNKLDEVEPVAADATQTAAPKQQEQLYASVIQLTKDIASTPLGAALRKGNNDLERSFALLGVLKNILADPQLKKLILEKYAKQSVNLQAAAK